MAKVDSIISAETQYLAAPDDAADRAHVLEKIIGYEREQGAETRHLERVCDALYGHSSAAERAAKHRRRAYAAAKRREEMQPYIDAIQDAYPDVKISLDWSRKHGRKTTIGIGRAIYTSSARYGAGDPDDLLPELPEIVRGLRATNDACKRLDGLIKNGQLRQQGGFAVLPASADHQSFDGRFRGIPLSLSHESAVATLKAVDHFLAVGQFVGRNAYGG